MRTLQPTLRLGRDVWNRTAMPEQEFRARADRLRAVMAARGLDALLLYGANLNGCGHPTYLANYIVKLPFAALVVLPRIGEPSLMFQGAVRGRSAAQATTWIEDVRPCWNMADTCLEMLAERRLLAGRLGLAGLPRLVPHDDWTRLRAGLSRCELMDAEDLVDRQRAIKSTRELAQIARATEIVRQALESIAHVRPSDGEWRLGAEVIRAARMLGAEDIRVMVGRPKEAEWALRPIEDAAIQANEDLVVLLAASWERYWSESIRTFRAEGDRLKPRWDRAERRFRALASLLQPGTTTGEWCRDAIAGSTPAERSAIAPYGSGNGIGVTPEEWPPLSADDETAIEGGMCFAIRVAVESEDGIVLHGDTCTL